MGDEFKGYIFRITGGNDKQGFPMKQGVLINGRVYLLLKKSTFTSFSLSIFLFNIGNTNLNYFKTETTTFRPRRTGHRKRKSVRGCICGPDLAVISLKIVKKGEQEVEGLTDSERPRRLGPKRANYIRKVFALRKKDDVRKYVVKREIKRKDKTFYKAPKIQRLITERRVRRKKLVKRSRLDAFKAKKELKVKYDKVLSQYIKERKALHSKKEEVHEEKKVEVKKVAPATTKAAPQKQASPQK